MSQSRLRHSISSGNHSSATRSRFTDRLLKAWRHLELPTSARCVVGVSGGADSTALLLALDELVTRGRLQLDLIIAHLDHRLREKSREDAVWITRLAVKLGRDCEIGVAPVKRLAQTTNDNLEQAARRARYNFFVKVAANHRADLVLTAHTLDDQAETVMMRLLRGSGSDGLGGIEPVRQLAAEGELRLVRPLVGWARRTETRDYCRARRVRVRADPMNLDERYSRVRVRRRLLPLMESFNGKIVENLARTAELLRDDATVLSEAARTLLKYAMKPDGRGENETGSRPLSVIVLAQAPPALRRRALRQWLKERRGDLRRLGLVHVIGIERLLDGEQGGRIAELPGGFRVIRKRGWIEIEKAPG